MEFKDIKVGQTVRLTKTVEAVVERASEYTVNLVGEGVFTYDYGWKVELVKDVPREDGWYVCNRKSDGDFYAVVYYKDGKIGSNPDGPFYEAGDYFFNGYESELTITRITN